jgi:hypothetical protein
MCSNAGVFFGLVAKKLMQFPVPLHRTLRWMPGLVPGIHVLAAKKGVDGRDKTAL